MAECRAAILELTVDDVPPTYDELKDHLGLSSKSRVYDLIKALRERGAISSVPHHARSLHVVGGPYSYDRLSRLSNAALSDIVCDAWRILDERGAP